MPLANSEDKFFDNCIPVTETGCWLWLGEIKVSNGEERGRVMIRGERDYAHRWAYRIAIGDIPEGHQVNHHCDQPTCVNPAHLYAGTQAQNVHDMLSRGRHVASPRAKNGNAKLTEQDVSRIRASDLTIKQLAEHYSVTTENIRAIRAYKTWKEAANG